MKKILLSAKTILLWVWKRILLFILLIIPTLISIMFGLSPGLISFASILLVYILTIDNMLIEAIKFPFLSIELKNKISEADELLKKLKRLAVISSECAVASLASTQLTQNRRLDFLYANELREKIMNLLINKLEIKPENVREVTDMLDKIIVSRYIGRLVKTYQLSKDVQEELVLLGDINEIEFTDKYMAKILSFLERNCQNYDRNLFNYLKHFFKTREHIDNNVLA